jgi:hypothetical protein
MIPSGLVNGFTRVGARSKAPEPSIYWAPEEGARPRVKLPIPKGVERRLRPYMRRGERFLRDWEWTWTRAFLVGIVISFFALLTLAVAPSWWLYFAEQELNMTSENRLLLTVRDIVAVGWLSVWAGFFVVTLYKLQVIRKRLRGEKQSERYSGGYR